MSEPVGATVDKPWGYYTVLDTGSGYLVKKLVINPGEATSLQYHTHRDEELIIVRGKALVERGDRPPLRRYIGDTHRFYKRELHRISNTGELPMEIIEVQIGEIISEDDIVRLEDKYGRVELLYCPFDGLKMTTQPGKNPVCQHGHEFTRTLQDSRLHLIEALKS